MQKLHERLLLLRAQTEGSDLWMMWRIRVSSAIVVIDHGLKIRIAAVVEIGRTLGYIPERRDFESPVVRRNASGSIAPFCCAVRIASIAFQGIIGEVEARMTTAATQTLTVEQFQAASCRCRHGGRLSVDESVVVRMTCDQASLELGDRPSDHKWIKVSCVGLLTHPPVDWVAPQLFRQSHDVVGKFILLLNRYKHLHFQCGYGSASQVIRMICHIPQTGCIACSGPAKSARAIGPLIGKPMFGKVTGSAADRAVFGQCALEEEFFTQLPACLRGQIVFGMRDRREMNRNMLVRTRFKKNMSAFLLASDYSYCQYQ